MADLPPKLKELDDLVHEAVRLVEYEIKGARRIPDEFHEKVMRLSIRDSHGEDSADAVAALKTLVAAERRREGERRRDERLAEIERRVDAIRAVLPSLAAAASIELGVIAREVAAHPEDDDEQSAGGRTR